MEVTQRMAKRALPLVPERTSSKRARVGFMDELD